MNIITPNIRTVTPQNNFSLEIEFENGEFRAFDVTPYLSKGMFKELNNKCYFMQVKTVPFGIEWPHHQDLSADTLYLQSKRR